LPGIIGRILFKEVTNMGVLKIVKEFTEYTVHTDGLYMGRIRDFTDAPHNKFAGDKKLRGMYITSGCVGSCVECYVGNDLKAAAEAVKVAFMQQPNRPT
jgi:hypothetical protein